MRIESNIRADAALILTTVIWGSTFVIAKDVLTTWPPISYITFRFTLAALLLVALFPRELARAYRAGAMRAGAALGLLMAGGFALQANGLLYTAPAKSAFITGLTTPLVPIVAFLLLRSVPSTENLAGVVLASLGGALILAPTGAGRHINVGDVLTLCATTLFATHLVLLGEYSKRHTVRQLTLLQIGFAALVYLALWLALRLAGSIDAADDTFLAALIRREAAPPVWSPRVVGQLAYLAVVATVVNFSLWTWGQARMAATHAAIIFSLEPIFATLFSVLSGGDEEWLGGRAGLGALLIFAGLIVSEIKWGRRRAF
ncbi:MAG TPA: DMT family transporter [Pyrinomonadaceae bacterium]|nr:DMT family transporter [Pyrinomonadaceae bacterium]